MTTSRVVSREELAWPLPHKATKQAGRAQQIGMAAPVQ